MAATEILTYSELASPAHINTICVQLLHHDLYVLIHDKVYNVSTFIHDHPGGEEVLLDVGGKDATESFEDVGHSDEAREILAGLLVGSLKKVNGEPAPPLGGSDKISAGPGSKNGGGSSVSSSIILRAIIFLGGAVAFGAYKFVQSIEQK